jgi:DNA-binding MarR family transcriptional regulator
MLTVPARRRLAAWQDHRTQLLSEALQQLSKEERALLARALSVLRHLVEVLGTSQGEKR